MLFCLGNIERLDGTRRKPYRTQTLQEEELVRMEVIAAAAQTTYFASLLQLNLQCNSHHLENYIATENLLETRPH